MVCIWAVRSGESLSSFGCSGFRGRASAHFQLGWCGEVGLRSWTESRRGLPQQVDGVGKH
eukprot:1302756-Rhodomonas_salina.1